MRVGVIGAARITPMALIRPSRQVDGVDVAAVAARDRTRADKFAGKHSIPTVHDSYDALLSDDSLDAVYNPLPNGLHAEWTIKALEAGKHVLCEKPFTANAAEARMVADAAERLGLVAMEAFHWRYHPLARRLVAAVAAGEIGELRHIEAAFCIPLPMRSDIRWRLDLAGGATMDVGSYTASIVRHVSGEEPTVTGAEAKLRSPGIDRWMRADLELPSGATGRVTNSMWSGHVIDARCRVIGTEGEIRMLNPIAPFLVHRFRMTTTAGTHRERFERSLTYTHQLRAFRDAVVDGAPVPTGPADAVANMTLLDGIYEAAGLGARTGTIA